MAEKFYKQNSWSGGLADSDSFGAAGSLAEIVGMDIHSDPGFIQASQAMTASTGSIIDFPKWKLNASDGSIYFFGENGLIYRRTGSLAYGTIFKDSQGTIKGVAEYNGFIYWAGDHVLSRKAVGATWAGTDYSWGSLYSAPVHPMTVQNIYLIISDGSVVSSVDATGTLTRNGTSAVGFNALPSNYTISAIQNFGSDVLLGTKITDNYSSARVFRWDTLSPSYNSDDDLPENGVNAFIPLDNNMLIQAGNAGNLYFYTGSVLEKFKKIKGDYANKTMTMYPDSVCGFRGLSLFGVSNLSGNPVSEGVYSLGQYDRNYPLALVLEYPLSSGSLTGLKIGALLSSGTLLAVGWQSGNISGIHEIDWTAKTGTPYVKTLAIKGERELQKTFEEYNISYKSKPAGTDIGLTYLENYASSGTPITLNDQSGYGKMSNLKKIEAGSLQFKIELTTSGNDTPAVEDFYTKFNEKTIL